MNEVSIEATAAHVAGSLGDPDEALAQVVRESFEVAVVDIILHGTENYAVADEPRVQGVPFVFASGYAEERILLRFADVHLWQKLFSNRTLVEDVRRLCEGLCFARGTGSST